MSDLEKEILGAHILNPGLFEKLPDLSNDLTTQNHKLIYGAQKRSFNKNLKVDAATIADELSGKVSGSYISDLIVGLPGSQSTVGVVSEKIRRLRVKNLWKKIIKENNKQIRQLEKSMYPDLSTLRELIKELDALDNGDQQILKSLSSIPPKEIDWFWWNRIPRGSLTLFVGDPGDGKSLLCEYLAARLSRGDELPDKASFGQAGNAIFITGEDNLADTVRIRADEANADCERIHVLDGLLNNEVFSLVMPCISPQVFSSMMMRADCIRILKTGWRSLRLSSRSHNTDTTAPERTMGTPISKGR